MFAQESLETDMGGEHHSYSASIAHHGFGDIAGRYLAGRTGPLRGDLDPSLNANGLGSIHGPGSTVSWVEA
jgi:hypothetical protein